MSLTSQSCAPAPSSRSSFVAGSSLQPGTTYRAIANGNGEVLDSDTYLLATDQVVKGNRLLVNIGNGATVLASPKSIWSK